MADKRRFTYAVAVNISDPELAGREVIETCSGTVEVERGKGEVDEAMRLAVADASHRAHSGRLMGKVFDDGC